MIQAINLIIHGTGTIGDFSKVDAIGQVQVSECLNPFFTNITDSLPGNFISNIFQHFFGSSIGVFILQKSEPDALYNIVNLSSNQHE